MISPKRLSKIIQERESKRVENYLLGIYSRMSESERNEIREMLKKYKTE